MPVRIIVGRGRSERRPLTASGNQDAALAEVLDLARAPLTSYEEVDIPAALRELAEKHRPEGGYGETFWNPGKAAAYWVAADWTSDEELSDVEDAMLAVPGVRYFLHDAETAGPSGPGWHQVWPE